MTPVNHIRSSAALLCISLLGAIVGCGQREYHSVEGIVTLDGAPLAGASLGFVPEAGGTAAQAFTNADGRFVLKSGSIEGAKMGRYKVTVYKLGKATAATQELPSEPLPPGKVAAASKSSGGGFPSALPEIYRSKDTTPLIVSVPVDDEVRLEMKSTK